MKSLLGIKGLLAMVKTIKCLYFAKKVMVILFFACLGFLGIKCMCGDKKKLGKLMKGLRDCC